MAREPLLNGDEDQAPPPPAEQFASLTREEDAALRPQRMEDMIGQRAVYERLKIAVDAARIRQEPLGHVLLDGPPGPTRGPDDIAEAAYEVLARSDLDHRLEAAADSRAASLSDKHGGIDAPWAAGLAEIDVMSRDLLAITIVWPGSTDG